MQINQSLPNIRMMTEFTNFEITPTLEEISQIVDLPLSGRAPLIPCTTLGIGFLQSLGLRVGTGLRRVNKGWVNLDYLFKRFGRRESYDRFQQEFFISRVDWERHKAIVFMVVFLSIMIFPKKRGCVDINQLSMVIYIFRGPIRVTIVPMILAEIFRSLSLCSRGYDHLRGSNLLLQIWVLEQFYQREVENGTEADICNKIRSHAMRLSMWNTPNNEEVEVDYEGRIPTERIVAVESSQDLLWNLGVHGHLKIKSNWHGTIEPDAHHHNHVSSGDPTVCRSSHTGS
ncbi:hypothetical protein KY285_008866 [Solanum tuberosum]|nr:hypothetical protein KY284_009378 [Solanum tuberosum]KAH0747209.1 hypothetical protein KY285_008866 [Solanum tuberosum]